jgi:hypothetical protein
MSAGYGAQAINLLPYFTLHPIKSAHQKLEAVGDSARLTCARVKTTTTRVHFLSSRKQAMAYGGKLHRLPYQSASSSASHATRTFPICFLMYPPVYAQPCDRRVRLVHFLQDDYKPPTAFCCSSVALPHFV